MVIRRRRRRICPRAEAAALFSKVIAGKAAAAEQELFRAQMLTEMARMSVEDGLVMQIHPGSVRNHNKFVYETLRARHGSRHSRRRPITCTLCGRCSIASETRRI